MTTVNRPAPNGHLTRHGAHDVTGQIRCRTCGATVELSWSPFGAMVAECRFIDGIVDQYPEVAGHESDPMVVLPSTVDGLPTMVGDDATVNAFHNDWRDRVRTTAANLHLLPDEE